MSYCRSSANCEIYCYYDGQQYITHVDANKPRKNLKEASDEELCSNFSLYWEPHTRKHAGETFVDDSQANLLKRMRYLKSCGWKVPRQVMKDLKKLIKQELSENIV